MPEILNDRPVFTLFEVANSIRKTLSDRYSSSFWVKAEMNKLNFYPHSGHCYPELVEKREGKIVAQLKATLWKEDYFRINEHFQKVLKEPLRNGIKILFSAKITFDPAYGLSLNIIDIDPSFSLGELEKEKQETIERLVKEGIFNRNKQLPLPLLPKRIAIISVETSKGYADFIKMIDENSWNYRFFHMLFPALLQGEKAIDEIRRQLNRLKKIIHHFDIVAIIRGGGGDVGLSCYNHYMLARDIALFPLPVVTGIGHATNETVSEMAAYKNAITPTALAEFLIQQFHNFSVPVQRAEEFIIQQTRTMLKDEEIILGRLAKDLRNGTVQLLMQNKHQVKQDTISLMQHVRFNISSQKEQLLLIPYGVRTGFMHFQRQKQQELLNLERITKSMSPQEVLKRGYSITRKNGMAIKSIQEIVNGDFLETYLTDGSIICQVEKSKKTLL